MSNRLIQLIEFVL